MSDSDHLLHRPDDQPTALKHLSQVLIQMIEMLDIYRAELASILGLKCSDVAQMTNGHYHVEMHGDAWQKGIMLIEFHNALHDYCDGNGVGMRHWCRRFCPELSAVPLLLMVDEGKLSPVLDFLKSRKHQWPIHQ